MEYNPATAGRFTAPEITKWLFNDANCDWRKVSKSVSFLPWGPPVSVMIVGLTLKTCITATAENCGGTNIQTRPAMHAPNSSPSPSARTQRRRSECNIHTGSKGFCRISGPLGSPPFHEGSGTGTRGASGIISAVPCEAAP